MMAGRRQTAFIAVLLGGMLAAGSAAAEAVPLPTPAPLPKSGGAPPPPSSGSAVRPPASVGSTAPAQSSQSGAPNWLPPIFGGKEAGSNLEPAQRALVDKVSAYLSKVQVMSGQFAQIGPDGKQSKGQFYVQKPGRVRFDYDPPVRIEIVADGTTVVVHDRKLNTQDSYFLSQTPLRFLLSDRIDLLKETTVTGVYADDLYVTVSVEEKQLLVGTSKLMMMFDAKNLQLKQWVVTDPQGYDTTIAVSNLDTKSRPDPSMFKLTGVGE